MDEIDVWADFCDVQPDGDGFIVSWDGRDRDGLPVHYEVPMTREELVEFNFHLGRMING